MLLNWAQFVCGHEWAAQTNKQSKMTNTKTNTQALEIRDTQGKEKF